MTARLSKGFYQVATRSLLMHFLARCKALNWLRADGTVMTAHRAKAYEYLMGAFAASEAYRKAADLPALVTEMALVNFSLGDPAETARDILSKIEVR